jgi:transposase-like protein
MPEWPFKRSGYFRRQTAPRRIQRFTCLHCGRSFSTQTFSTTYWQKRPDLDRLIFTKVTGCMANRQIARDLQVAPSTIDRHVARLGRHCFLFHQKLIEGTPPPGEVVIDGFESFEFSQYFPIHHHVAVEKHTDFFIYFTDSPLRRKGRMTGYQKKRRTELEETLGRPDPKAIELDMAELIRVALRDAKSAVVYSDDHRAYRRSIGRVDCQIRQEITPGKEHRDQGNSLWEVNLLDLLIRHSSSNHKRETIAWSKRRQASAERLAIFLVWRNYMKGRREKERGSPTPGMVKGLTKWSLGVEDILRSRIFRTRMELPSRWAEYYDRRVETPVLGVNLRHELIYAY